MEVKTLSNTLSDVEAEAGVEAEIVCDTLSYLGTKPLVNPLGDTLAVVEANSFAYTLGDVEAKALVNACPIVLLR